jgi:threonine 3-dehydrogenase
MYMLDGVRALNEIAFADREKLSRAIYNIAAFSPRADEIAASVNKVVPDAKFTYSPDPKRQAILDSWPKSLDDSAARTDWGWKPKYDLDGMTNDLIPRIKRMLELGAILSSH